MKNIEKLPSQFVGTGAVKGFIFTQVLEGGNAYIYAVKNSNSTYYEVFKKRIVPKCIDFKKRLYSETDFKEHYPKASEFGIYAFTTKTIQKAKTYFDKFN